MRIHILFQIGTYCYKNQVHFNVIVLNMHKVILLFVITRISSKLYVFVTYENEFLGVFGFLWRSRASQIHSYWLHCLVPVNHSCNVWSTRWGLRLRWKQHLWGVWRNYRFHTRKNKQSISRFSTAVCLHWELIDPLKQLLLFCSCLKYSISL